jgi:VWFA-related protein
LKKRFALFLLLASVFLVTLVPAQEPEEQVEVNLVLIETLVLDRQGRTVPDLTKDDFTLTVGGRAREIDVLDVHCPVGAVEDSMGLAVESKTEIVRPPSSGKIVLLFDYYNLPATDPAFVIDQARMMVGYGKAPDEEVMIALLANGVRIEQRFTSDTNVLLATLERMKYDVSPFAGHFISPTGRSFFENMTVLMDVLAEYDGPKAVVMFSSYSGAASANDLWYQDVATHAAAGRTVLYPAQASGMGGGSVLGSPGLGRLANESGGRMTSNTNDLSVAYRRAQRDLGCRYTVGFYVDPEQARKPRSVRVRVEGNYEIRAPEIFRTWSEEQRRKSRMRAAFADPDKFSDPLVRSHVFVMRPASKKSWDAVVALQFPISLGLDGAELDVSAVLTRDGTQIRKSFHELRIEPQAGKPNEDLSVMIVGGARVKPGTHELRIVMAETDGDVLQTTRVEFTIPEIPKNELVLRGPILARVVERGLLLKVDGGERSPMLEQVIGPDASFEPLLVHQIDPDEILLARWELCSTGGGVPTGVTIHRTITSGQELAYSLDPVDLDLQGKKIACQGLLDRVPAATLLSGRYRFNVEAVTEKGEAVARGLAVFGVRGAEADLSAQASPPNGQ